MIFGMFDRTTCMYPFDEAAAMPQQLLHATPRVAPDTGRMNSLLHWMEKWLHHYLEPLKLSRPSSTWTTRFRWRPRTKNILTIQSPHDDRHCGANRAIIVGSNGCACVVEGLSRLIDATGILTPLCSANASFLIDTRANGVSDVECLDSRRARSVPKRSTDKLATGQLAGYRVGLL